MPGMPSRQEVDVSDVQDVLSYIKGHWHDSVHDDSEKGGLLPHPYTVPCITGKFNFFFYWDTFFTNVGLLGQNELELARNNIEDMMFLVRRWGFMPNHVGMENRSQPPYFGLMVRDCYRATGEDGWLEGAAQSVRDEYYFWRNARWTRTGLARHGHNADTEYLERFHRTAVKRAGQPEDVSHAEKLRVAAHYLAEAETGWDFNPRFDGRCMDFNPVDLNANLYAYEQFLLDCSLELGWDEKALWEERSGHRAECMRELMWNGERGMFMDYDFENDCQSPVASLASFQPLWVGMATPEEARRTAENLELFEGEYGFAVTEKPEPSDGVSQQWQWPNMWPPLAYTTACGLARYGLHEAARRVARKYVQTCVDLWKETGQLWEKLDVTTGEPAGGEYEAQPMMGWSAGAFVALADFLLTNPGR